MSIHFISKVLYESSSDEEDTTDDVNTVSKEGGSPHSSGGLIDVEDMGQMMSKMKSAKSRRLEDDEAVRSGQSEAREMVTPMLRQSLTKQGSLFVCLFVCLFALVESAIMIR